jgi:hypothetical protein
MKLRLWRPRIAGGSISMPEPGRRSLARPGVVALCLIGVSWSGCAFFGPGLVGRDATSAELDAKTEELRLAKEKGNVSPAVHRDLGLLLADPRNPSLEYPAALRELERYAALEPRGAGKPQLQSWLALLRSHEALEVEKSGLAARLKAAEAENASLRSSLEKVRRETSDARKAAETLTKENAELEQSRNSLRQENQELRQTISKLKELDLRMDELRRMTR